MRARRAGSPEPDSAGERSPSAAGSSPAPVAGGRLGSARLRFPWLLAVPVLALMAWRVAPLATGQETLFLRDVFTAHLSLEAAKARAIRAGTLPLVDPGRAGGQPLAGNLNAAPLYPDNLLLAVAPLLWAYNAHFWLHWLAAPFALYALARGLGVPPPGAWAAGAVYALSGFFVSQLAFYNLVAGAALAPAFAAACVLAVRSGGAAGGCVAAAQSKDEMERGVGRSRFGFGQATSLAAAGGLWALLVLAGDPVTALVTLALGLTAIVARPLAPGERRPPALRRALPLAGALAAGTLLALPQIVATLQILPTSYRAVRGYSEAARTIASFDPRQALEWLLPFAFGRPDLLGEGAFWGHALHTGAPAFYFTLYPGLLALGLLVAAGRPRGAAAWWGWIVAAAGVFVALGRFNPLTGPLVELAPVFRYPMKAWLAVAVGLSVVCGIGFARALTEPRAARRLTIALATLAVLTAGGWIVLAVAPGAAEAQLLRPLIPGHLDAAFVAAERLRWAGLCGSSALIAAALAGAAWLGRRRAAELGETGAPARAGGALLLTVHAAAQLVLLAPAMSTDSAAFYRRPPPLLEAVPPDARLAHGAFRGLFGESTLGRGAYPEPSARWLARRAWLELYPFAAAVAGRGRALDVSPEGLDSYLTHLARAAVEQAPDDAARARLLAAWGIERLILDRELDAAAAPWARPLAEMPSFGHVARVYGLAGAAPEIAFATEIERAAHPGAALEALLQPGFDPRRQAVLAGDRGPAAVPDPGAVPSPRSAAGPASGPAPELRLLARGPESLRAEVVTPRRGVLVWNRAWLPLYRAEIDGAPAPTVVANLQQIGVEVPAGRHEVRVFADRRPLRRALAGAAVGALLLALVAAGAARGRW